jgi:hypothetical protein
MSADIKGRKLPSSRGDRAFVIVLVGLVHVVGIWAWMKYGGLNKTPALPPMMVVMDPPPKPQAPAKPLPSDAHKPADQSRIYLPDR